MLLVSHSPIPNPYTVRNVLTEREGYSALCYSMMIYALALDLFVIDACIHSKTLHTRIHQAHDQDPGTFGEEKKEAGIYEKNHKAIA